MTMPTDIEVGRRGCGGDISADGVYFSGGDHELASPTAARGAPGYFLAFFALLALDLAVFVWRCFGFSASAGEA